MSGVANAEHDSTVLLAKVEVVATYWLAVVNQTREAGDGMAQWIFMLSRTT